MQTIELHLRAKHFEGTEFVGCGPCAIQKALMDAGDFDQVAEHVSECYVYSNGEWIKYTHDLYGRLDFEIDAEEAASLSFDDTIIRTLILTPCTKI